MRTPILLLFFFLLQLATWSPRAQAQILDPRVKAVTVMALYGTIGGFLLGTASLAFHKDGRSISRGTSLGLYAGLLFGGYVVGSHYIMRQRGQQDTIAPTGQADTYNILEGVQTQLWNPPDFPLFYLNLFQLRF